MPNTEPAIDSAAVVRQVLDAGATAGLCDVRVSGSITVGREGRALSPMAEMAALGVRIFTDDGSGVQDDRLMRRALEYASGLPGPITLAQHCEVEALSEGGHMHEGEWSSRLGIPGIPPEAEELMVFRDIALARLTGARVHFQHLSTAGSVDLVRQAKARGLPVTAEATPHHFTLTHAEVASYDPVFKVNPPLRSDTDVAAVKAGLADGTIDAIATDHAPHTAEVKEAPFDHAPCGMLGLETALALALTELVEPGVLTLPTCWPPCRGARPGSPASATSTAARSPRASPPTWWCSTRPRSGRSTPRSWPAARTTRPMPGARSGAGPPHPAVRRTHRARRGGPAMSAIREALLVLADGTDLRGRGHRRRSNRWRGHRRGRVQHRAHRLPGDHHRPVLRRADHHLHLPPHRQLRRHTPRRRVPPALRRGVIVRDLARRRSSWRAEADLDGFLRTAGVAGIAGIDTRRLTRHIRDAGAMPGAFGTAAESVLKAAAAAEPGTDGIDLVRQVSCTSPYTVDFTGPEGRSPKRVVAYDFGIKTTILRHLSGLASVEVVPAGTPAADVLARRPDGVFLSNGPGDPAAVSGLPETIAGLLGEVPVFGICLGHQLLATALGADTYKLPFGHHGGNHPVRRLATGTVEITSQNHNFAVDDGSLSSTVEVTHRNLNDGVVEGLRCLDAPAFSVQYHPEAGPGPHDAAYLFELFDQLMDTSSTKNAAKGTR